MKKLRKSVAIALVAAQLAAQPAMAAEGDRHSAFADAERGAFAGARLRVQLGGAEGAKARASLAVAPTVHSRFGTRTYTSTSDGFELAFSPGKKAELTLAGQRLDQLSLAGEMPDRNGMSDLAKVAIVAGVVIIVGGLAFFHVASEASCLHGDGDGSDC